MSAKAPQEILGSAERPASPTSSPSAASPRLPPSVPDHELLRCIGRGSYGEVWLARNIMGAYRAVKIVYRATFDSDRPYDREFEGLRKFEPISRSHESQVHILQVGRNDKEGYFYHVRELADNALEPSLVEGEAELARSSNAADLGSGQLAAQTLDPDGYVPRTLASELKARQRLPFDECLGIGQALTTALEHLHGHGLIHRDIKPANVIFVNGRPKLADIGLVASVDATCSFVGTEGYLPPEGPASPQSDIYSLGKVLYEIGTGNDRREFPELPTQSSSSQQEEKWLMELNAIVMRACKLNPQQRYASASQMHEDLLLLMAGNSVRRSHALERRLAVMTRVGVAFAVITVLGAVPCYLALKQAQRAKISERREYEQRLRAEAEAAKNRRIAQFLQKMLKGLEPSLALGEDTSVARRFLDQTAVEIGKDLQSQPAVEAEMRSTLGLVYFELGYPSQASVMYAKALELQQQVHGQEHPAVAQALSDFSFALCTQGKLEQAEALQRRALTMRRQFPGDNSVAISESLHRLGSILVGQSKLAGAEAVFQEALALRQRNPDDQSAAIAESLTDIGSVLAAEGRWAESGVRLQRALEIQRRLFGEDHPNVASLLSSLVSLLIAQDHIVEAEARAREALAIREKVFSSDHPAIAESLTTLGDVLSSQDKFAEAETPLREALAIRQRRFGNNDPALAVTLDALVNNLLSENKDAEAEKLLNDTLAAAGSTQLDSPRLLRARGSFLARVGRWRDAEADFSRAIDLEPNNHETYHELAPLYVQSGDIDQYRQLCRRIKQQFGSIFDDPLIAERMGKDCLILPPDDDDLSTESRWAEVTVDLCKSQRARPWAEFYKGLAEYRQGQFQEAIGCLQSALTRAGDVAPRDVEAYMVLAMAQFRSNKPQAAREALAAGEGIAETQLPKLENNHLEDDWKDCLIAYALTREAKALINGGDNPLSSDDGGQHRE
jgi:tetratricopeptide (TPR) repeat protein